MVHPHIPMGDPAGRPLPQDNAQFAPLLSRGYGGCPHPSPGPSRRCTDHRPTVSHRATSMQRPLKQPAPPSPLPGGFSPRSTEALSPCDLPQPSALWPTRGGRSKFIFARSRRPRPGTDRTDSRASAAGYLPVGGWHFRPKRGGSRGRPPTHETRCCRSCCRDCSCSD